MLTHAARVTRILHEMNRPALGITLADLPLIPSYPAVPAVIGNPSPVEWSQVLQVQV